MTPNKVFNNFKSDTCLLYTANKIRTRIIIINIYGMLVIFYEMELLDALECIKKENKTLPMGQLERFSG